MIQRIQSVYLFVTAILMSLLCFFPLAEFVFFTDGGEGGVNKLFAWGIIEVTTGNIIPVWYTAILLGLTILLPLVIIFLYKKRWLQMRLCIVQIILLLGMQIYVVMYLLKIWKIVKGMEPVNIPVLSIMDMVPLVSIILVILALRGIFKDQTLIKSLNRIR
ncbi:MAG: DUF4293 domain-containing protein [Rikenellaceae bacterium]|nr:DUF4293 domain-containing protein [Rikenellaceae bacterium]